jgi:hypothetical protein
VSKKSTYKGDKNGRKREKREECTRGGGMAPQQNNDEKQNKSGAERRTHFLGKHYTTQLFQ